MTTHHGVMQGAVLERDADHFATRFLERLLHCDRHFARLALAHTNATVAITDHGQRREAEYASTLDHFGHAIDSNHLFAKAVVTLFAALHSRLHSCHVDSLNRFGAVWVKRFDALTQPLTHWNFGAPKLELQPGLACCISQRFDPSVILVARPVKGDGLNTRSSCLLCDTLTHSLCC